MSKFENDAYNIEIEEVIERSRNEKLRNEQYARIQLENKPQRRKEHREMICYFCEYQRDLREKKMMLTHSIISEL